MSKPRDWSDQTYFLIGAVFGFLAGAVAAPEIVSVSVVGHILIVLGSSAFFGAVAVLLRENLFFFFVPRARQGRRRLTRGCSGRATEPLPVRPAGNPD